MDTDELRERYEAFGDETVYAEAVRRYEDALAGRPTDVRLLASYGYLQEWHGRRAIRAAADRYEQAIAVDPRYDKPHWQLVSALAAEWRFIVDWCEQRRYDLAADWPKRELQRLTAQAAGG